MQNSLLAQYKRDGAAGFMHKPDQGSVAASMRDHGSLYGPSQSVYYKWKHSGVPTAELMQNVSFGMSTRKGETAGDVLAYDPSTDVTLQSLPKPRQLAEAQRANPITWADGSENTPMQPFQNPHAAVVPEAASQIALPLSACTASSASSANHHAFTSAPLSNAEMTQNWSDLMRQGRVKLSAATSLIEFPPELSIEPPPKIPALLSQGINTIGLHGHNRQIRRSNKFTSDFRDPFQ